MRCELPQAPLKHTTRVAGVGTGAGQAPAAAAPRGSISHGASLWNKAAAKAVETLSEVPESARALPLKLVLVVLYQFERHQFY